MSGLTKPDSADSDPSRRAAAKWLAALVAAMIVGYALAFPGLLELAGGMVRTFALSYILLAAWFFGLRWGLLVALINIPLNIVLYHSVGQSLPAGPLGPVVALGAAALVGRLSDRHRLLAAEAARSRRTGEELAAYKDKLEEMVSARTAALIRSNEQLEQEIAGRRSSEKELRQSEQRYRTLYQTANDAIFLIQENLFVDCNPKTLEIFCCTREQILGHTPVRFSPPVQPDGRDSGTAAAHYINQAYDGEPQLFQWEHCRYDGTPFPAEIALSRMELNGKPHLLALVRDITQRKKAQQELMQEKLLSDHIINSLPGIFYLYDKKQRLVRWNKKHQDLLGYTAEELSGAHAAKFFRPKDREKLGRAMADILDQGETSLEVDLLSKTGRSIPFFLTIMRTAVGGKNLFLGVGLDITVRKSQEREKRDLQARLQQAQKMEAIGALAGGIAHDFNNILGAILGYTELALLKMQSGKAQGREMEEVLKAGERAKALVQQILSFSRQNRQEPAVIQITPVVFEALKLIRASLPASIEIQRSFQPGLGAVLADPTEIHQVIMNLCTNGAHAMWDAGGVLTVGLEEVELGDAGAGIHSLPEPGKYLKLTVSDTGRGMDRATSQRIFEPFFTTKGMGKGTGMGLSVVHGIVSRNGGAIDVESEPGSGSVFTVYLPVISSPAQGAGPASEPDPAPSGAERILLVDDEQALVDVGMQVLSGLGYMVTGKTSSPEALELFRQNPDGFDLVITDQTMPKLSGTGLTRQICAIRPGMPIIICTGFSDRITDESVAAAGAAKLILKPLSARELAQSVRGVLDR